MAKPTSLPRWADVGGDIVEPASGKKDTGWIEDEIPPAQYFNWLENLTYQWLVWLDAGVFNDGFSVPTGDTGTFDAGSTLDVNGVADLSGATALYLPERSKMLDLVSGRAVGGSSWAYHAGDGVANGSWTNASPANGEKMHLGISLDSGDRLKSVAIRLYDDAAMTVKVFKSSVSGTTQLGSTQTSAGNGTEQTMTVSGLTEVISTSFVYYVEIANTGAGGIPEVLRGWATRDRVA